MILSRGFFKISLCITALGQKYASFREHHGSGLDFPPQVCYNTPIVIRHFWEDFCMNTNDLFAEKSIFSDALYCRGIYPAALGKTDGFVKREDPEKSELYSIVLPLRRSHIYVIRFPEKTARLRAAVVQGDPRLLPIGGAVSYARNDKLPYYTDEPQEHADFMHVSNREDEYLVLFTGGEEKTPVCINESPILLGYDTEDDWYVPPMAGDLNGGENSWGKWDWTSDEVFAHLYEPLRAAYPDYISRMWIGKEQTGVYDMWAYLFEPENYEQTLFITSGLHASEMDGYLGLARFIELLCKEDGSHAGLHYLRTKVKIVLIPIVNVWGASVTHERPNSTGTDLNRDYSAHAQAETVNVLWLLHQYKNEAAALIDCHTSRLSDVDLYYQFSIQAPNAPLCLKVTNHIYEDLKRRGLAGAPNVRLIPGAYNKSDVYLQGYAWNKLGIPTLVIEHEHLRYYPMHSAENLQLAAEYYGNFIIQTALAKLKLREK